MELSKNEGKPNTEEEEKRWQSHALFKRVSENCLINQQQSRDPSRDSELRRYLDVLQEAMPKLPDDGLLPSSEERRLPMGSWLRPRLSRPVIIPQGQFRTSTREFCQTYAPVLRDCGIEKKEFLGFIDDLNRVTEPSTRDHAINIGGFASAAALTTQDPMLISMAYSPGFHSTGLSSRHSTTNDLLEKANIELFRPRGLVCFLVICHRKAPEESKRLFQKVPRSSKTSLDQSQEEKRRMQPKMVERVGDVDGTDFSQLGFYTGNDSYLELSNNPRPRKRSYRTRKNGTQIDEHRGNRPIFPAARAYYKGDKGFEEARKRRSTSRYAKSRHLAGTKYNTILFVGVGRLPAANSADETDEKIFPSRGPPADPETESISKTLHRRVPGNGKTVDPDAMFLMIPDINIYSRNFYTMVTASNLVEEIRGHTS
ncbi:hypothetical protein CORC01_11956 [Colletotrichum orchidophilum]|uniref:Uncharacterized protein n=1 Tax=Colletotrichum orchidophilum TaxID=1209926 RepID=A0A1G4AUA5_9PEZI|nr:uncharacterized protein CORC01_11956 [Colletotrichum orchidophilum]OHE92738.1 hypothetical protein CORC01_11956 [Colletotrichum orchidophilum]